MDPSTVNPHNFQVESVLFDNGDFSVVYGVWEKKSKQLAMRWNGSGKDAGYPKTFGNPVWFIITEDLKIPIIKSLLGVLSSNKKELLKVLDEVL